VKPQALLEADRPHDGRSEIVTVAQIADRLGRDRSTVFRQIKRNSSKLGVTFLEVVTPTSRGMKCAALPASEARRVIDFLTPHFFYDPAPLPDVPDDQPHRDPAFAWGAFYVIAIVPDLKRERVKLGYSASTHTRLGEHRTSAPTAELVKEWPCKPTWELTARDFITREGCTRLGGENYDCDSLDDLIARADAFFAQAPRQGSVR